MRRGPAVGDMSGFEEVREQIGAEGVTLVITASGESTAMNRQILQFLTAEQGLNGVYVSVTKPYEELKTDLGDDGILVDHIHFIDAVSVAEGRDLEESDDVTYLESAGHLTDISIGMKEAMKKVGEGRSFLFFDSISSLEGPTDRFAEFLTEKLRSWDVTGIILSVEEDITDTELIDHLRELVDHVVDTRE